MGQDTYVYVYVPWQIQKRGVLFVFKITAIWIEKCLNQRFRRFSDFPQRKIGKFPWLLHGRRPLFFGIEYLNGSKERAQNLVTSNELKLIQGRNPMLPNLTSTRVVITEASSGLGIETARALGDSGCQVILGARLEGRLREICDELGELQPSWPLTSLVWHGYLHLWISATPPFFWGGGGCARK